MEILDNQTLKIENALSFRGQVTQQELAEKTKEIEKFLENTGVQKAGPTVSTTFSIQPGTVPPVMDVEILIPLQEEITPDAGMTIKKHFCLSNALKLIYVGNPMGVQEAILELNQYIISHNLVPVTSVYYVSAKESKTIEDNNSMEVHIYIGVSENRNTL